MKIAIVYTPEIKNIGNAFINRGAKIMLERIFSEHYIYEIEAFESGNDNFNYPSTSFTDYNKQLMESCDWLIVLGGSCLSKYLVSFFNEVKQLQVKKILLGVGFYEGIKKELPLHRDLPEYFDHIFTRDEESATALQQEGKYNNVYSGLDMAFWMNEYHDKLVPIKNEKEYSIINIDSPERGALQTKLCKENPDHIITRNNSYHTHICNGELGKEHKCFIPANWYEFYRLYANARYVATNRVHTFLNCLLTKTPCQVFMDYISSYERFFLFGQLGLKIQTGKLYTKEDYDQYAHTLTVLKLDYEGDLKHIIL